MNWGCFWFTWVVPGLSWLLVPRVVSNLVWRSLTAALLACLLLPCMKASMSSRLNRRRGHRWKYRMFDDNSVDLNRNKVDRLINGTWIASTHGWKTTRDS